MATIKPFHCTIVGVVVVVSIFILSVISKTKKHGSLSSKSQSNDFIMNIRKHLNQLSIWVRAAEQDKNDFIAMMHMNYAAAYATLLRDMMSSEDFLKLYNLDIERVSLYISELQRNKLEHIERTYISGQADQQPANISYNTGTEFDLLNRTNTILPPSNMAAAPMEETNYQYSPFSNSPQ